MQMNNEYTPTYIDGRAAAAVMSRTLCREIEVVSFVDGTRAIAWHALHYAWPSSMSSS